MSQEVEESLQSINQSASLMLRLVNDVLDLSKIESGKLQLEEHEFDIREFFQNLASSMSLQVQAKRNGTVKFVFNMSREVPHIVKGDSVRLLQIAYNILSNACKFTEEGTITFSLDVQHRGKSAKKLFDDNMPTMPTTDVADNKEEANPIENDEAGDHTGGLQSVEAFSMSLFGDKRKPVQNSKVPRPHGSATRRVLGRILEGTASFARSDGDISVVEENKARSEKSKSEADVEHGHGKDDDDEMIILRMSFQDTGTGIPEEQLGRIFQPYAQSKLSDFRKHGGTGLGLSIISKLLEMMGGTVKVFSEVGKGSTFVIHLPLKVPKHQYATDGKSGTFITAGTTGSIDDASSRNYMPIGSDLLEDVSNRNNIGASARAVDMHAVSPETSLFTTVAALPEKLDTSGSNGNSAEPPTSAAIASSAAPSPLFGINNSNNLQPDPSDAKPAPLFGGVTNEVLVPGANTPAKSPNTASVPLFGITNSTPPTAVQPAPLFGATSALPSNSTVSSSSVGPGSTPARIVPRPPVSSPAATKVRQLAEFHFEKNNNLVLVTDDNAVRVSIVMTLSILHTIRKRMLEETLLTMPLLFLCFYFYI